MQTVTVKFQKNVLKIIDATIAKHNFNSRTEFLREAVRDKLAGLDRDELIKDFMKFHGKSKIKTTYEQNRKTREKVSKELEAELKKKFRL